MGWYIWVIVKEAVKQIKRQQLNRQTEVVPLCLLNKVLFYFNEIYYFSNWVTLIISFINHFLYFFSESCCKYPNIDERCEFSITFFVLKKNHNLYNMRIKWNLRKFKIYFDHTDGNCVFPSTWNSTWYDSSMGDVIMSNSSSAITSGWTVTAYTVPVTSWTCVSENTTDSIMLFKWDFIISKLLNINNENISFLYFNQRLKIKWE